MQPAKDGAHPSVLQVCLLPYLKVSGAEKVLESVTSPLIEGKEGKEWGGVEEEGGRDVIWTGTIREQRKWNSLSVKVIKRRDIFSFGLCYCCYGGVRAIHKTAKG